MPLYAFQERFAPMVQDGRKRQTIRARRKNRPKVGQMAFCYRGLRTQKAKKLGSWVIISVQEVSITRDSLWIGRFHLALDLVPKKWMGEFARMDGFTDWPQMIQYFEPKGFPFEGDLIMWHWE